MNPAASSPAALEFTGVSKYYGRQRVLDELSLSVAPGEFFGLVGNNGAGKTTCIKGLLDFCGIQAGAIGIFGVPHTETRARARLAYLPERFLPPYYLTGRDFLKYMARLHGVEYDETEATAMFRILDLDGDALSKAVREYSKGMAQKLGLAACFLSGKELLVLDEPTAGLDPKARILTKRHLQSLKSRRHGLFFSTHVLTDVEELCDRIGILHGGRLRFVGSPSACCDSYQATTLEDAYLRCISD